MQQKLFITKWSKKKFILALISSYLLPQVLIATFFYFPYHITFSTEPPKPIVHTVLSFFELTTLALVFKLYKPERLKQLSEDVLKAKRILVLPLLAILDRIPLIIILLLITSLGQIGERLMKLAESGVKLQRADFSGSDLDHTTLFVLSFMATALISPIYEELLFRGLVFNYFKSRVSVNKTILFSSLLFAFAHINPILIVFAFFTGILLSYVYYKFKNILYPILLHILINSIPFLFGVTNQ